MVQRSALDNDKIVVAAYGESVPQAWAGMWLRSDGNSEHLVAAFSANYGEHRIALRALVAHPDQLDCVQVRYSMQELIGIRDEIHAEIGHAGMRRYGISHYGVAEGENAVIVGFSHDHPKMREVLHDKYGEAVRFRAGVQFAYAPGTAADRS